MTGPAAAMGQMVWEGVQVAFSSSPRCWQPIKLAEFVAEAARAAWSGRGSGGGHHRRSDRRQLLLSEVSITASVRDIPHRQPAPLVTQNRRFAFRAAYVDDFQGEVEARFAWEHLQAERVAVLMTTAQCCSWGWRFSAKEIATPGR